MRRNSVSAILALALAGAVCPVPASGAVKSADKAWGEPRDDQALVYVIREGRFQGSGRTMFVYADEQFLGTLENNSYTFAYVPPGEHMLWLNWARIAQEVELEAGKTYYFSVWTTFSELDEESGRMLIGTVKSHVTPEPKEEQTAQDHIRERHGKAEKFAAKPAEEKGTYGSVKKREAHVEKWPQVDLAPYSVLYVEDFAMADPKAAARKKEHLVETAPRRLADQVTRLVGDGVFDEIRRGVPEAPTPGSVVLSVQITQYKPGSETARFMLAGTGSAHLDFAAQLADGESGEELSRFTGERTFAWGGAYGASKGIEEMERNVAYELALYLKRCKGIEEAEEAPGEEAEPPAESEPG